MDVESSRMELYRVPRYIRYYVYLPFSDTYQVIENKKFQEIIKSTFACFNIYSEAVKSCKLIIINYNLIIHLMLKSTRSLQIPPLQFRTVAMFVTVNMLKICFTQNFYLCLWPISFQNVLSSSINIKRKCKCIFCSTFIVLAQSLQNFTSTKFSYVWIISLTTQNFRILH